MGSWRCLSQLDNDQFIVILTMAFMLLLLLGGQLLGTGPGGPIDEGRRIQAEKWAEDQKLKKRYAGVSYLRALVHESNVLRCV